MSIAKMIFVSLADAWDCWSEIIPEVTLFYDSTAVQYSAKEKDDLLSPDVLAKKLVEVKQLHKEVEDLRTAISDRYAQDMGDNCITQ